VKDHIPLKEYESFKAEAKLMSSLEHHPNLVRFIGITSPPDPLCLLLEFCPLGSLFTLLQDPKFRMSSTLQFEFLLGIANGMNFLHKQNIVHRDLAARNVLLTTLEVTGVKIADFGMSRHVDLLKPTGQTKSNVGPVLWMPPESLQNKIYSTKSDIWAFGIVIFEITARKLPYEGIGYIEVARYVIQGGHVKPPPDCPPILVQLLEDCCKSKPDTRPTFGQVVEILQEQLTKIRGIATSTQT